MTWRVLIVEDEPELQILLRRNLEMEGYEVLSAETGEGGVEIALREHPDIIILDLMLPKMTGFDVCRKLRDRGLDARIIMLTARATELDRISGLDGGADDFLGKPFSLWELQARMRAQLRNRTPTLTEHPPEVQFGNVTVNLATRRVHRDNTLVDLTTREFDLLEYFVRHLGDTLSREQLLADVWKYDGLVVTRTVDNFVAKLRKHLEADPLNPLHLLTVHGSGYRLVL